VEILAAVSEDERSLAALPWAATLARQSGAPVRVLSVAEPGAAAARQNWLDQREEVAAADWQVTVREGSPAEVIIEEVQRRADTLLCMATRARTALSEPILGSVAGQVLRAVDRPVLLVGPRAVAAPLDGQFRRIVATLDGSPTSEAILPVARDWARRLGTDLRLLGVVYPLGDPAARVITHLPPEASELYEEVARRSRELQDEGLDADWWIVADEEPAAAITDHLRLVPSWLLFMATHGRSALGRVLLGSVTANVVRRHTGLVMVYRPAAIK
jgi:nucleotide-binding universal stress UspA family protein